MPRSGRIPFASGRTLSAQAPSGLAYQGEYPHLPYPVAYAGRADPRVHRIHDTFFGGGGESFEPHTTVGAILPQPRMGAPRSWVEEAHLSRHPQESHALSYEGRDDPRLHRFRTNFWGGSEAPSYTTVGARLGGGGRGGPAPHGGGRGGPPPHPHPGRHPHHGGHGGGGGAGGWGAGGWYGTPADYGIGYAAPPCDPLISAWIVDHDAFGRPFYRCVLI